jgi:outer membrane protein OmpA-like peptidoglycan-associated protein
MRKLSIIGFFSALCFVANTLSAQAFKKAIISNVAVINSTTLDFSPTFHKDGIIFLSNNTIDGKVKMYDDHIKQKTMSLFIARQEGSGQLSKPEPFAFELVSQVHEGPLSFEKDYKTVYLSRNDHKEKDGKAKYEEDDIVYMKIYVSKLDEKGWSAPKEMSFNIPKTDACHPALSPDGNRLYFSSNRTGGYGGMDLYVCEKIKGEWALPKNMGNKINSENDDVFPFVHEDGTLYFSSNRFGGKGGLDIYTCPVNKANRTSNGFDAPQNIGEPLNSEKDDFGFILDNAYKTGYFSSSRDGGRGLDDIYTFSLPDRMRPMTVTVLDRKTKTPLPKSEVCNASTGTQEPSDKTASINCTKKITDADGKANIFINVSENYFLTVYQAGYINEKATILKDEKKNEIIVLMDKRPEIARPMNILILDSKTKQPIKDVDICYANADLTTTCEKLVSDVKGKANVPILSSIRYSLKINKANYNPVQAAILKNDTRNEITVFMEANNTVAAATPVVSKPQAPAPSTKPTTPTKQSKFIDLPDSDYDQVYCLRHIYYDYDKATLRPDAQFVMDSLIEILNHFPEMEIEMASHTDSRGNAKYNQALSERRVASVVSFLENQSINKARLRPVAFGKAKMIECPVGVKCTEEMIHQLNRCTEVKLIKKGRLGRGIVIPASH